MFSGGIGIGLGTANTLINVKDHGINHLGAWPLYGFAMQGLALVMVLLIALPFRKKN